MPDEALRRELEEAREEIKSWKGSYADLESDHDALRGRVAQLENDLAEAEAEKRELMGDIQDVLSRY